MVGPEQSVDLIAEAGGVAGFSSGAGDHVDATHEVGDRVAQDDLALLGPADLCAQPGENEAGNRAERDS